MAISEHSGSNSLNQRGNSHRTHRFTTDHIETLDEIDIEFREEAERVVQYFDRVECFNMEEEFIDLCVNLIEEHLDNSCKSEIRPCCQNCVGSDCLHAGPFNSEPVHYSN